jgi:hypothetical protein
MSQSAVRSIQRRAGGMVRSAATTSACALAVLAATPLLNASTIRHDVPDSSYTALANDPQYASVGAVSYRDPNLKSFYASGTLISPYWVLTAAHVTQDISTATFNVGGNTAFNGTTYGLADHFSNPNWPGALTVNGNDIGLIRLSTPVTNITPASRYYSGNEIGQIAVSVGFGLTGTGLTGQQANTLGTKRAIENNIDVFGSNFGYQNGIFASDFDDPTGNTTGPLGSSIPRPLEGCIAAGDSGGGAFISVNGRAYVAGVHSFFARNPGMGDPNGSYGDYYASTRVTQYNTWIDDNTAINWVGNSSGSFTDNSRWTIGTTSTNAYPTAYYTAGFNVVGNYTVTFDGSALQNYQLLARNGNITLNLNGSTYSLLSQAYEGALVVGRYSGNSASITLTAGTLNTRDAIIGQLTGSSGRVIMGANSTWNATGDVYVGGTSVGPGGGGTIIVANSSAAVNVSGTLRVLSTGTVSYSNGTLSVGTLDVAGGRVTLPTGSSRVLQAKQLMISGLGKLDLNDNDMIINYDGASPISDVRSYVASGFNNGLQTGNGIISTRAKTSPNAGESGKTRVGFSEASSVGLSSFDGIAVDGSTILLKYTYAGDANLDGMVDLKDLAALASSWQTSGYWSNGDFNYDGTVNASDLGLLSTNWQAGTTAALGPQLSLTSMLTSFGLPTPVPEPVSMSMLLAAAAMLRRRRRA